MTDFHLDMAFDWDSLQKPGTGYAGFLQIGLVKVTGQGQGQTGTPASFADIDDGDTLEFYLYDISEAPNNDVKTAAIASDGSWLTFGAADSVTSVSAPVAGNPTTGATFGPRGSGSSSIFSRNPQDTYPEWSINASNGSQLSLSMANAGNFFFTLVVSVTNSQGTTKTFGVDPEMIVKS
jgi:hypothetical protein